MNPNNAKVPQEFLRRLTASQGELFAFIGSLLVRPRGVDDILQNTNLALMKNAALYDPRLPFLPWAQSFAYNQVRAFLRHESRERVAFDDSLVEQMGGELAASGGEQADERLEFLAACMDGLDPGQKDLIQAFYYQNESVERMARQRNRSSVSVRVQLHRIRALLAACIQRKMKEGSAK